MAALRSQGLPATRDGRAAAMHHKDITSQWLKTKNVKSTHPHLGSQQEIGLRVRLLKGYDKAAMEMLYETASARGPKPFPVGRSVLLSADILSPDAFTTLKEKNAVPAWRAGEAGAALHREMSKAIDKRAAYQESLSSAASRKHKDAFVTGAHLAAFARLYPHVRRGLEATFGAEDAAWPDPVATLHAQLMGGEHDSELLRVSQQLQSHYDTRPIDMLKMLQDPSAPIINPRPTTNSVE